MSTLYDEGQEVLTLFPLPDDHPQDRATWHWCRAFVENVDTSNGQVPEYLLLVEDSRLAETGDDGTVTFPMAFRDASEIKPRRPA